MLAVYVRGFAIGRFEVLNFKILKYLDIRINSKYSKNKLFDNVNIRWLDFASIKFCFHSKIANRIAKVYRDCECWTTFPNWTARTRCSQSSKCQFYLIASTRRLRAPNSCSCQMSDSIYSTLHCRPNLLHGPSRQWPTVDRTKKCSF